MIAPSIGAWLAMQPRRLAAAERYQRRARLLDPMAPAADVWIAIGGHRIIEKFHKDVLIGGSLSHLAGQFADAHDGLDGRFKTDAPLAEGWQVFCLAE